MTQPDLEVRGVLIWKGYLGPHLQAAVARDIEGIAVAAPFVRQTTPWGRPMSVEMTSAGRVGWIADRRGYRYEPVQPSGAEWPPIPPTILDIWRNLGDRERLPDCCLVNRYGPASRMGLHQDKDEGRFDKPVISISLGDDALFRIGGRTRKGSTESVWLSSGDVVVLGGEARLAFHGVDRISPGTSALFANPGRINLTLRVVDR